MYHSGQPPITMISEGTTAPGFRLPGTDGEVVEEYRLSDHTDDGPVVLTFYLFDFHPECTDALCAIRDAEWLTLTEGVDVLGIGTDGVYSHRAFATEQDLEYPLLSDSDGSVSEQYGVLHDEIDGHRRVAKRAAFVVDTEQTIRYAWSSDDPQARPDIEAVAEAATRAAPTG